MTSAEFVQRWEGRDLTERAAAQSHFTDLCRLLDVPAPTDNRVTDSDYGFEARTDISASGVYSTRTGEDQMPLYQVVTGSGTSGGFADVWKRRHFAWEYKRANRHPTLQAALAQLRIYAASLGNPPLLIVSDIDRIEVHTNFTNYPATTLSIAITDLARPSDRWKREHPGISALEVLRKVFVEVDWFKPKKTRQAITTEFAEEMGNLAIALRESGGDPHAVAHLIVQIVFCFFAEDIGLLPKGLFVDLIAKSIDHPAQFPAKARALFKAMELGGSFGAETIDYFNGGLFKDVDRDPVIQIAPAWLGKLLIIAKREWDAVDPSIFGTLFERSLDPGKRSQIGAHYTSREDIMLIVEPVVMQPLRRKWVDVQKDVAEWLEQRKQEGVPKQKQKNLSKKIEERIHGFVDELGSVKILDPACGSGNFLYVTIQQLLDLENEVRGFAARPEIAAGFTPRVRPSQLMGIDVNDYACELARVSIWIGYLQWLHANASSKHDRPILDPLNTIEHRDAILKWANDKGQPIRVWQPGAQCKGAAEWPQADFIIGNPPFLGSKVFRQNGLPDDYVQGMYDSFDLPKTSDLCAYWFEVGRSSLKRKRANRVGLLATQGIRGRENRTVLERIKNDGDIFMAWSDREWILDGAAVHVSIIGFDDGTDSSRLLDGNNATTINVDLTSGSDSASAHILKENLDLAYMGTTKGGAFDIELETARKMFATPNPNRRSNADVIQPWVNGSDLTQRSRGMFIIDFGCDRGESAAAAYEAPFDYVAREVKPDRIKNRRESYAEKWWIHVESRPAMRIALKPLNRFLVTTRVAKHRLFRWFDHPTLPDSATFAFARSDDLFFGLVQNSMHEVWSRRLGTQLREVESGFRYTPSTCFETFPLPWPPGKEPVNDPRYKAIAAAAKELNELRENWLNPPEWIKPIEDAVDRFEDFTGVTAEAKPLLRHSAIMARAAQDKNLKKRTLTNLYNERSSWLKLAHRKLDEAVLAAYKAIDPAGDWDSAWAAAYEPFGAGEITIINKGKKKDSPEMIEAKEAAIAQRKIVDEKILANLLRLNLARSAPAASGERKRKGA